ncbi:MAG: sodium:solute symporter family protein [Cyanobacteria bacterium P01_D01_bin.36]
MQPIDWLIVLGYLLLTMGYGLYLSRRTVVNPSVGRLSDYLTGNRTLSWWLAGTSMAATTFSVDTPLYIAGIVGNRGIAGNWEWWSFAFAHVLMVYLFARLWRRSEIMTDAELSELRYGGKTAAILRGTKAFLFAVPMNCIGLGYAMLAMTKVIAALQLWEGLGLEPPMDNLKLLSLASVGLLVLLYSGFSMLWNAVVTDFLQFFLALFGSVVVAIASVNTVGGIRPLLDQLNPAILSFVPADSSGVQWGLLAGLPASPFLAYVVLQWWSFRRSDGGGEFVQRLAATKTETEAEKAAWLFSALHYVVRTWPWIIAALAAVVLYPNLSDRELGYPLLMVDTLPPIILGMVVASLLAAFLSTASTLVNWGAAYLSYDLYGRYISPRATLGELAFMGRLGSVLIVAVSGFIALTSADIAMLFRLAIAVGTGPGLVLILRWFWWRINAVAELTAVISGVFFGVLTSIVPGFVIADFGPRLIAISFATTLMWVTALLLSPPESNEVLDCFYAKVRPGGPGWKAQRQRTGLRSLQNLSLAGRKIIAALLLLFGSMFTVGGFLLFQQLTGWLSLIIAVGGGSWLNLLNKQQPFLTPRPGTEDG